MFQFPGLSAYPYGFRIGYLAHYGQSVSRFGDPRFNACFGYAWLFAVSRVLLRRTAPRHPPCALSFVSFGCCVVVKVLGYNESPRPSKLDSAVRLLCDVLLRKEVIQPHLPIRLPCYDFTPIVNPTFDGCLLAVGATGFGCCSLSWCDGRCVQGPGTYSPQHADLRLLAIPASRRRVSACDLN